MIETAGNVVKNSVDNKYGVCYVIYFEKNIV